jgi:hypothetical protein
MSRTLDELHRERTAIREDKAVCEAAYDVLRRHVKVRREETPEDLQFFLRWSGKDAVMGSLELAIHHLGELVEKYEQAIEDQSVRDSSAAGDNIVKFPEKKT